MSLIVVDAHGQKVVSSMADDVYPPLLAGQQYSYQEYVGNSACKPPGCYFLQGKAIVKIDVSENNVATINIVSPNARDLAIAKGQAFEMVGIKHIPAYPTVFGNLNSFWHRFRWLLTGQLPE